MTDKELRKLNRAELLEMLIDQSNELQALQKKLDTAEVALQQREITINKAGSIAEAALQLNHVFEATQAACQQYTDNIVQLSQRQEAICAQLELESRAKAERLIADAEKKCAVMENETKVQCAEMVTKAKAESQKYWDDVSSKLETFYTQHAGLREILAIVTSTKQQEVENDEAKS